MISLCLSHLSRHIRRQLGIIGLGNQCHLKLQIYPVCMYILNNISNEPSHDNDININNNNKHKHNSERTLSSMSTSPTIIALGLL